MTRSEITERTRIPLIFAIALASTLLGSVIAAYGVRDAAVDDIHTAIKGAAQDERRERSEALRHYLTREEALQQFWQLRVLIIQQTRKGR